MTVYRIQSKQDRTRGAYRSHTRNEPQPDVVHRLHREHSDYHCGGKHPSPKNDINRDIIEGKEHCGCPSAASLLRWFRGFIPDLLRAGYEIVALRNVTVTAVGEYQVLFKWGD